MTLTIYSVTAVLTWTAPLRATKYNIYIEREGQLYVANNGKGYNIEKASFEITQVFFLYLLFFPSHNIFILTFHSCYHIGIIQSISLQGMMVGLNQLEKLLTL